jgi:hypothetical protein
MDRLSSRRPFRKTTRGHIRLTRAEARTGPYAGADWGAAAAEAEAEAEAVVSASVAVWVEAAAAFWNSVSCGCCHRRYLRWNLKYPLPGQTGLASFETSASAAASSEMLAYPVTDNTLQPTNHVEKPRLIL